MKADEEDKLFHTDGAWWTFLKSGKWNGENDYTLFVEFVDLMFTSLTQGKVDWEKRPMFIKDQDEKIARIQKSMILLGNEMERHPFSDILGSLHQDLSSLSHRSSLGSFYTPDSVCQMCAGTVNSADLRRKIENGKTVSILDPACGSARMPLAMAAELEDVRDRLRITCVDIELLACKMAYVNLAFWDIPATIIHGDTLRCKEWGTWKTPSLIIAEQEEKFRQKWEAIIDFFKFQQEQFSSNAGELKQMELQFN